MQKPVAMILILAGLVLLGMGVSASESFISEVSQFFTGEPSDKTMYLLGGSLLALVFGGILLASSRGHRAL